MIDGTIPYIGADVCPVMVTQYTNGVNQRLSQSAGVSPVKISGGLSIVGDQATVTAHFELVDPGTFNAHQGTLFIYEDDITWCCGYGGVDHWDDVVRMVRSSPVTLTTVGQVVTLDETMTVTSSMNPANLHAVAVYERIAGGKEVVQSTDFVTLGLSFPVKLASVPQGNGTAYFTGTVINIGDAADVAALSIDNAFGWPADFQVEGDPNYYQNHNVALGPGEDKQITVRVQTDGVKRIGSGTLTAISQNTGNTAASSLRVFNGSYAILFVDADNGSYEAPFTSALNSLGYLYDTVTAAVQMVGYDAVIWHTGYQTSTLTQADMDGLAAYLDAGGKLFLSSMDFLTSVTPPNAFVTNYLGVESWANNTKCHTASGVSGDPITDGMLMALSFPQENANRVDTVNPTASAAAIFFSEHNPAHPNAVRLETRGFRTVFSTIHQSSFPTSGTDPNNSETVIEKTLNWLLQSDPTAVGPAGAGTASRFLQTGPNPSRGATGIWFALSQAGASDVHLTMVDASGRQVRTLAQGPMSPGAHEMVWDGRNDLGRAAPTGIYFALLKTSEGVSSSKVVIVR